MSTVPEINLPKPKSKKVMTFLPRTRPAKIDKQIDKYLASRKPGAEGSA